MKNLRVQSLYLSGVIHALKEDITEAKVMAADGRCGTGFPGKLQDDLNRIEVGYQETLDQIRNLGDA